MSLKRFLSKPDLQASVAIANMCAIGLLAGLHFWMFPDGIIRVNETPAWKLTLDDQLFFAGSILAFPLGYLADAISGGVHPRPDSVLLTVVSIPVNAYLWGYAAQRIAMWRTGKLS